MTIKIKRDFENGLRSVVANASFYDTASGRFESRLGSSFFAISNQAK
jgi:hypothetical protein